MFLLLRNRLGIPGFLAIGALVFAMIGGAYAANDPGSRKATASAKGKPGPRGPRGPRGKTGPAGPAGPAGPQGPAGPAGAKGDKGDSGANGHTGATGPAGSAGKTGPTGPTGVTGPPGAPWPAGGTLPKGATETGSWALFGVENGAVPVSFAIALAEELGESHVHFLKKEETDETHCTGGTAKQPKANEGELCVYTGEGTGEGVIIPAGSPFTFAKGASHSGAALFFFGVDKEKPLFGTWAVTGK
jgi:hypothetical protein